MLRRKSSPTPRKRPPASTILLSSGLSLLPNALAILAAFLSLNKAFFANLPASSLDDLAASPAKISCIALASCFATTPPATPPITAPGTAPANAPIVVPASTLLSPSVSKPVALRAPV